MQKGIGELKQDEPPHLIVWFSDAEPRAAWLDSLPRSFVLDQKTFHAMPGYFGDADYLRDREGQLVGFGYAFAVEAKQIKVYETLLSQSPWVRRYDGMLVLLLHGGNYEIECVQAMGSQAYQAETGEVILAVPNWGFGPLAFDLSPNDAPWPDDFGD